MHTPEHNPSGYDESAISNMTALNQTNRFLLAHGTTDDNVHIQNTLSLVDQLNVAGVTNFDLLLYPDSDHDIHFHDGRTILYQRRSFPGKSSKYDCADLRRTGLSRWLAKAFSGGWDDEGF